MGTFGYPFKTGEKNTKNYRHFIYFEMSNFIYDAYEGKYECDQCNVDLESQFCYLLFRPTLPYKGSLLILEFNDNW